MNKLWHQSLHSYKWQGANLIFIFMLGKFITYRNVYVLSKKKFHFLLLNLLLLAFLLTGRNTAPPKTAQITTEHFNVSIS